MTRSSLISSTTYEMHQFSFSRFSPLSNLDFLRGLRVSTPQLTPNRYAHHCEKIWGNDFRYRCKLLFGNSSKVVNVMSLRPPVLRHCTQFVTYFYDTLEPLRSTPVMWNILYDDYEWASNYECQFWHVTQHRQHMKMISCPFTVNTFCQL